MADYPDLENLIGGWFHQDFDLNGNTLAEVIAAYRAVTPADQQRALSADVARFLAEAGDVDMEFQERFKPDVLPTGFAPTTRAFLEAIVALVGG